MSRADFMTGSKAHVWTRCPASPVLPHVKELGGAAADRGILLHQFQDACLDAYASQGEWNPWMAVACMAPLPADLHDLCAAWLESDLMPWNLQPREAFVVDVATGSARRLGRISHRAYGELSRTEVPVTPDASTSAGGTGWVQELKTGPLADVNVPRVTQNPQAKLEGLALALADDLDTVHVAIQRVSPTGWVNDEDKATFDVVDLALVGEEFRAAVERVNAAEDLVHIGRVPDVFPGPWCDDCDAFVHCPAKTALLRKGLETPQAVLDKFNALLEDPETRTRAFELADAIKTLSSTLQTTIHALAARENIKLRNGNMFGKVPRRVTTIDPQKAWALLVKEIGPEAAIAAFSIETSSTGLKRGARAAGRNQAQSLRKWLEVLTEQKAVTVEMKTSIREFRPGATQVLEPGEIDAEPPPPAEELETTLRKSIAAAAEPQQIAK